MLSKKIEEFSPTEITDYLGLSPTNTTRNKNNLVKKAEEIERLINTKGYQIIVVAQREDLEQFLVDTKKELEDKLYLVQAATEQLDLAEKYDIHTTPKEKALLQELNILQKKLIDLLGY